MVDWTQYLAPQLANVALPVRMLFVGILAVELIDALTAALRPEAIREVHASFTDVPLRMSMCVNGHYTCRISRSSNGTSNHCFSYVQRDMMTESSKRASSKPRPSS